MYMYMALFAETSYLVWFNLDLLWVCMGVCAWVHVACGRVQLAGEEKQNVRLRSAAVHVGIVRSGDEKIML